MRLQMYRSHFEDEFDEKNKEFRLKSEQKIMKNEIDIAQKACIRVSATLTSCLWCFSVNKPRVLQVRKASLRTLYDQEYKQFEREFNAMGKTFYVQRFWD